jgi:uncharacterized protein YecE (DUF72 family)
MSQIRIGTSGFSFPDWRGGVIYPKGLLQKEELIYYQKELGFDTLEVNATYYALLSDKTAFAMEQKTGKGFEFVVKGFRGFTHDPFDDRLAGKKPSIEQAFSDIEKFNFSLKPFSEAGKLGAVLLQFPVFFYPSKESQDYIVKCKKAFAGVPLVIEFRNIGWAKDETFGFLKENDLAYCAVDEPKLERLMPFKSEVTSGVAYFRLHGRNQNWFNAPASVRYDYLYSEEELESFLPDIGKMAEHSKKMYIFMNNCHAGSAVKNAKRMKQLLDAKHGGLF